MQAVETGTVKPDEKIVLNITGGGQKRLMQDYELKQLPVSLEVSAEDEDAEDKVIKKVAEVFEI
jgi:cysteate synthase